MTVNQINDSWTLYKEAVSKDSRLSFIKAFRDRLICDSRFSKAVGDDLKSALTECYPRLTFADIVPFVSSTIREQIIGDINPSDEALILKQSLNLDAIQRNTIRELGPLHKGWNDWRNLQIQRFSQEDKSLRASQITHIPFAIELTQGCSGGCAFCGLSASPLHSRGEEISQDKNAFESLLRVLHNLAGDFGRYGILYWATDPLDHPHYELYADQFAETFDIWPSTTTALGETQLDRIRRLIAGPQLNRPWGLRLSMRSPSAFTQLCKHLSPQERAMVRLLPQYNSESKSYAIAGRKFEEKKQVLQPEVGGTIACMSGFLISLPKQKVELITPCLADSKNINGYRTISKVTVESEVESLADCVSTLCQNLPCPPIHLDTRLKVSIDNSQFHLYPFDAYPNLLTRLENHSASFKELALELRHGSMPELYAYCLFLVQTGALQVMH